MSLSLDSAHGGIRDVNPGLNQPRLGSQGPPRLGLGNASQEGERVRTVSPVDQDARQRLGGAGVVRFELEGLPQGCLVTGGDERVGLARRRRETFDECLDLALGDGTDELVHDLPVGDGENGGDGLDGEGLGDARVLVHVDLGQLDVAPRRLDGPLQHGPQRRAGPAPGCPEIHDDRHGGAPGDHIGLKCLIGDVHRPRRYRLPAQGWSGNWWSGQWAGGEAVRPRSGPSGG